MLDLELLDDASIRVLAGRLTSTIAWAGGVEETFVVEGLAVAYSMRVVLWAGRLAESIGYHGQWALGVAATGLRGHSSAAFAQGCQDGPAYSEDDYLEVTTAHSAELTSAPGGVAAGLVEPLCRGLGSWQHWQPVLAVPARD